MNTETTCAGGFDEALVSGLLDGVLAQGDRQRVRLHLESCDSCSTMFKEMAALRTAARTTRFGVPPDDQWDEKPRTLLSRVLRDLGLSIVVLWLLSSVGFLLASREGSNAEVLRWLFGGSLIGWLCLLGSAFLDRSRTMAGDIYRRVKY